MTRLLPFLLATITLAQIRVDFPAVAVAGSDNTLYAISGTNLFRTTDLGANWTAAYPTAAPGQLQQVLAIATNPLDPATVYAGTDMDKGGVWKSTDSGVTWTKMNSGLPATGFIEDFFTVENQPAILYAKIGTTLYKTSNAGAVWLPQSTLPAAGSVFTINARAPNLMYFVRQALGDSTIATVFRSSDGGVSWDIAGTVTIKPVGGGLGNSVGAIASSPADPELVFLSTRGPYGDTPYTAIHKSTNRGASFTVSRANGNAQRMLADSNGNIFWTSFEASAAGTRFEKTSTAGTQWEVKTIAPGLQGQPQLSVDLRRAGHMFAAHPSGVYRSTDAGESWTRLSGAVRASFMSQAPIDLQSTPGNRITRNVAVRFFEGATWTAPFTAAVEGASWLTLSAASGNTPATLELRASTEGLTKGSYAANIRLSSSAATGDLLVPVTLTVTDALPPPRSYRISTFAGGGTLPPVGAPPTEARFSGSYGVVFDPSGNLIISDTGLNQIYRARNGVLELIAGSGTRGSSGDDGPAAAAQLSSPTWVAPGNSGDLYVADTLNFRIRRIDSQGIISAVTTGNRFSLGGMLVDLAGNLYSASSGEIRVRTPTGSDARFALGPPTPGQLTRDARGNFYVPDQTGHQVLRITSGAVSTVVAGTGSPGYSGDGLTATASPLNSPRGIAVDPDGNIFIADTLNYRVRMIDASGAMFTIAGTGIAGSTGDGGLATAASLSFPYSLALDPSGNLYMGDANRVRKLTLIRPTIKAGGVANAASYTPDSSPGSLVAIFGEDLASGTGAAGTAPWPTTLAGATVTLNGRLMPLYYVSPGQVNAMVPYETPLGPATLVVSVGGVASASYTVNISQASPGVIGFGDNRAVAVNQDGSINTAANPAKPGSVAVIYLIGIGPTDLPVATGAAAPLDRLVRPTGTVFVTLGSQVVTPQFLGLTPGSVALAQLNLKLDDNLANGDYAVRVTIAGKESNAPLITVRR